MTRENVPQKEPVYSPYVGQSHPDRVYWGDSHLHTSYSWDAGLAGNTLGPDEAYRFAKGQQVIASTCHLTYDAKHHAINAAATRKLGKAIGDLFDDGLCITAFDLDSGGS